MKKNIRITEYFADVETIKELKTAIFAAWGIADAMHCQKETASLIVEKHSVHRGGKQTVHPQG